MICIYIYIYLYNWIIRWSNNPLQDGEVKQTFHKRRYRDGKNGLHIEKYSTSLIVKATMRCHYTPIEIEGLALPRVIDNQKN